MKLPAAIFASIAITLAASAAPALLVETTIAEHHGKDVLARPRVVVESGKQAVIQVGKLECSVTPTLIDGGNVSVSVTVTKTNGGKTEQLAAPRVATPLGKVAEIQTGELSFTFKTSLAK